MTKVKICGITNLKDAKLAVSAGCDALGFVFYKKSPRYITPQKARGIIEQLPKRVTKIGVFVNSKEKTIKQIAKLCSLDMLQFHSDESWEFCQKFKDYKIIKAFRINPALSTAKRSSGIRKGGVKDRINLADILRYKTFAYLFDTFVASKIGGTGKKFDWKLIRRMDDIKRPIFLSGGLNVKNVKEAIQAIRPDWVDVSSSVELRPGKKDHRKVREFIQAVRR